MNLGTFRPILSTQLKKNNNIITSKLHPATGKIKIEPGSMGLFGIHPPHLRHGISFRRRASTAATAARSSRANAAPCAARRSAVPAVPVLKFGRAVDQSQRSRCRRIRPHPRPEYPICWVIWGDESRKSKWIICSWIIFVWGDCWDTPLKTNGWIKGMAFMILMFCVKLTESGINPLNTWIRMPPCLDACLQFQFVMFLHQST